MSHRKPLERRTFLQDRLEILIKRQKTGTATFNELTELDAIVNSDPEIRKRIIMENLLMEDIDQLSGPSNEPEKQDSIYVQAVKRPGLLSRIKSFLTRIFISQFADIKNKILTFHPNQTALI
jgi:hypothetical protein